MTALISRWDRQQRQLRVQRRTFFPRKLGLFSSRRKLIRFLLISLAIIAILPPLYFHFSLRRFRQVHFFPLSIFIKFFRCFELERDYIPLWWCFRRKICSIWVASCPMFILCSCLKLLIVAYHWFGMLVKKWLNIFECLLLCLCLIFCHLYADAIAEVQLDVESTFSLCSWGWLD